MTTLNPAMARAFALLRNELYEYLDASELLAEADEDWRSSEIDSARKLIRDLVEVIRAVLSQHEEDRLGGCRLCHVRRWPCDTITVIDRVLHDENREFVRITAQ